MERCPSWLKEHDWKSCVLFRAAPRVRIPLSPPPYPGPIGLVYPIGFVSNDECHRYVKANSQGSPYFWSSILHVALKNLR